jgi:hypothetical protein
MDIAVLRDWIIVIGGFLLLILIIVASILGFLLYRDFKNLNSSINNTLKAAREMGSSIGSAVKSIKWITSFFQKKEEKSEAK